LVTFLWAPAKKSDPAAKRSEALQALGMDPSATSGARFVKPMARCGALQTCRRSDRDAARTRFDQAMRESGRRV